MVQIPLVDGPERCDVTFAYTAGPITSATDGTRT